MRPAANPDHDNSSKPNWFATLLGQLNRPLPQQTIRENALSACLPNCCALCQRVQSQLVCDHCATRYLGDRSARCSQCAIRLPASNLSPQTQDDEVGRPIRCGQCQQHSPAYDHTMTLGDYHGPLKQFITQLKTGAGLVLSPWLGQRLSIQLTQHCQPHHPSGPPAPDLLLPVPVTLARLRERGFNQAWEITRQVAKTHPCAASSHLLQKIRTTQDQHQLPLAARFKNVKGAFALSSSNMTLVHNKHIGVIDDVMTTGATLHEIARLLKRHGALSVTNLVVLRTPAPHTFS